MESEMRLSRKCLCSLSLSLSFFFANVLIQLASVIDEISFFKLFSVALSLSLSRSSYRSLSLSSRIREWITRCACHALIFRWNEREKGKGKKIVDNLPMFQCMCCRRLTSLTLVKHHQETLVIVNAFRECESNS
jgi:hypothetical protein